MKGNFHYEVQMYGKVCLFQQAPMIWQLVILTYIRLLYSSLSSFYYFEFCLEQDRNLPEMPEFHFAIEEEEFERQRRNEIQQIGRDETIFSLSPYTLERTTAPLYPYQAVRSPLPSKNFS